MSLILQLTDYINAAFSGLWVQTFEPDEAEKELVEHGRQSGWTVATWDIARGLRLPTGSGVAASEVADPISLLRGLPALAPSLSSAAGADTGTTLILLPNFHRYLNSVEIVQVLAEQLTVGKQHRTFIVVLSPVVQIPLELEKRFVVIDHVLPTREQLGSIAREILSDAPDSLPTGSDWQALLDAASGLTREEAEGAFALSLARHDALRSDAVWELKAQSLRKQNLLTK